MITLNHILVPHDFGDTSKTAMDNAIALARMFSAVDGTAAQQLNFGTKFANPLMAPRLP